MKTIFDVLVSDGDRCIAIVGGGGKTTLMFYLAHEFKKRGQRVISGTTTRILYPTLEQSPGVVFSDEEGLYERVEKYLADERHVTVAKKCSEAGKKLLGAECRELEKIFARSSAERMVLEADGARQMPLKAAGENEPLVCGRTDLFIAVVGLDSIGTSLLNENVFRAGLVAERSGTALGDVVTPHTVARLMCHREGLLKGCPEGVRSCVFFNKSDLSQGRNKARAIVAAAAGLSGRKPDFWVCASLAEKSCEYGSMSL